MNKSYNYFFLGLIFFLSCSDENIKRVTEFPEIIPLKGETINGIEVYSAGNVNLVVIDTFLIIQKDEEKFISIYSTNSHDKLAELGLEGRGPTEFKFPELLKQTGYDHKNSSPLVYIYDVNRRRTSTINIYDAIDSSKKNIAITELESIKTNEFLPYFYYQNNSFCLATPESGYRFLKLDLLTGEVLKIPFIPTKDYEFSSDLSSMLYRSAVVVNEEQNLFAAAPISFGQLDFFDLDGNYLKSTVFNTDNDDKLKNDMNYEDLRDLNFNIVHLQKYDEHIYALNYNNIPDEMTMGKIRNNMEVQVYDWNGNAIKKYELTDKRVIASFAMDKKHNRIYGYTKFEEDHNIIVYDLE